MFTHRITVHGSPFVVERHLESNQAVSGYSAAKGWASEIPATAKQIELRSCNSAAGGPFSNAQMLANRMNVPVFGYDGRVSNMNGNSVRFEPQPPYVAAVTGRVNDTLAAIKTCGRHQS